MKFTVAVLFSPICSIKFMATQLFLNISNMKSMLQQFESYSKCLLKLTHFIIILSHTPVFPCV